MVRGLICFWFMILNLSASHAFWLACPSVLRVQATPLPVTDSLEDACPPTSANFLLSSSLWA